jgi:hypothetical protein
MNTAIEFNADDLARDLFARLLADLEWFEPKESLCDVRLMYEAIRSLLLECQGRDHRLEPLVRDQEGTLIAYSCPPQSWRLGATSPGIMQRMKRWAKQRAAIERASIERATDAIATMLLRRLDETGIVWLHQREFGLFVEALRSFLYRRIGLHHPLQEIAVLLSSDPENILH